MDSQKTEIFKIIPDEPFFFGDPKIGKICGYTYQGIHGEKLGYIEKIVAVEKGKGLGTKLLLEAIDFFKQKMAQAIFVDVIQLEAGSTPKQLKNFCRKNGFKMRGILGYLEIGEGYKNEK